MRSIAADTYQILKALLDLSQHLGADVGRRRQRRGRLLVAELAQPRARALDRETLLVQQVANAEQQLDVAALVEALLRARLLRLEGPELGLPVAQHVGLDAHETSRIADLEEGLVGNSRRDGHRASRQFVSLPTLSR